MLGVLDVRDDVVQLRVGDRALREARHQVRADPHGLRDLTRSRVRQRRDARSGHVAAACDLLVAARAVVGEELHPRGEVAALRLRRGDCGTVAERCDERDQLVELALAEHGPRALGLVVRVGKRHVARAQVEVGAERAAVLQRGSVVRDALSLRTVAPRAVGRVQPGTGAHQHDALVGERRRSQQEQQRDGQQDLHAILQFVWKRTPAASSSTSMKKRTFPRSAACAKKCIRPSGPAASLSTLSVARKTTNAAASAASTPARASTWTSASQAERSTCQYATAASHRPTATKYPSTWDPAQASAPPNSAYHCRSSRRVRVTGTPTAG